jgi:hypothetical protein
MFSSYTEPVAGRGRTNDGYEPEPGPPIPDGSRLAEPSAVDLRSVPPGTELVVETRNSRYRVVILDDRGNALVQGGCCFKHQTTARIHGSTFGGSALKRGWITRGLYLELSARGKRIVTSHVRSIYVEPSQA